MSDSDSDSDPEVLFIKGYKVDLAKIQENYNVQPEDPQNRSLLGLWKEFPLPFKYLGNGYEPNGRDVALVMVFEEGYDREALEGKDIPSLDAPYDKLFTPDIWVKH